jgi:hypothetical protein
MLTKLMTISKPRLYCVHLFGCGIWVLGTGLFFNDLLFQFGSELSEEKGYKRSKETPKLMLNTRRC